MTAHRVPKARLDPDFPVVTVSATATSYAALEGLALKVAKDVLGDQPDLAASLVGRPEARVHLTTLFGDAETQVTGRFEVGTRYKA